MAELVDAPDSKLEIATLDVVESPINTGHYEKLTLHQTHEKHTICTPIERQMLIFQ